LHIDGANNVSAKILDDEDNVQNRNKSPDARNLDHAELAI
jgi:hypothetical protein